MTGVLYYITALNILSIFFLLFSLLKLRKSLLLIKLEESKYTLLFGVFGIRSYVYGYIVTITGLSIILWLISV